MATKAFPVVSPLTLPKVVLQFLVGGLGGIAPMLLRSAVDLSQKRMTVADISLSMIVGVSIFFFLGGAVAAIWGEVDLKKVFYIGLGLPSLITVATSAASAPQSAAELSPKTAAVVISNARFQAVSQNTRLQIVLPPEVGYSGAVATFYGTSNTVTLSLNEGSVIDVPDEANEVMITTPRAQSARIALKNVSANSLLVLNLAAEKDPFYGLKYAVGVHSKPLRLIVVSQHTAGRTDISSNRHAFV